MGTVIINGQTFRGDNITINGNKVLIDGKEVIRGPQINDAVEVRITGGAMNVFSDKSISCGQVNGDVQAGGSVNCDSVGGSVHAGGSVNCDEVGGDVTAGGSINRG